MGEDKQTLDDLHDELTDAIREAESNGEHTDDQLFTVGLRDLIRWREIIREAQA